MDFSMDNITQMLSSLSDEEFQSLRDTAQSILGGEAADTPDPKPQADPMPDAQMLAKLGRLMHAMQHQTDTRSALIGALKPYLSEPRQKRADEVMQLLRMLDVLPMLGQL